MQRVFQFKSALLVAVPLVGASVLIPKGSRAGPFICCLSWLGGDWLCHFVDANMVKKHWETGSFKLLFARDLVLQSEKTDTFSLMAQFTTRVELHRATGEDYARLHSAMEQSGFSRMIKGADGNTYLLPTAEYERSGEDLTGDQIHNDAWRAAASVSQRFSILITEAVGITWSGLTQL